MLRTVKYRVPLSRVSTRQSGSVRFGSLRIWMAIFAFPLWKVVDGTKSTTPYRTVFWLPLCWGTKHTDLVLKGGARNTALQFSSMCTMKVQFSLVPVSDSGSKSFLTSSALLSFAPPSPPPSCRWRRRWKRRRGISISQSLVEVSACTEPPEPENSSSTGYQSAWEESCGCCSLVSVHSFIHSLINSVMWEESCGCCSLVSVHSFIFTCPSRSAERDGDPPWLL